MEIQISIGGDTAGFCCGCRLCGEEAEIHVAVMQDQANIEKHNLEIQQNMLNWEKKPILRKIYRGFYELIATQLADTNNGGISVELGSGIGNIKDVVSNCLRTDLFPNPWLDRVENAYKLSFQDNTVSNIVLFDVFHHLRYPGTALNEMNRVLKPGARLIIFEPYISIFGYAVYGLLHPEPVSLRKKIEYYAPAGWNTLNVDYYAAQGNATRIFFWQQESGLLSNWRLLKLVRLSAISYVLSGGYSEKQLYPDRMFGFLKFIDRMCDGVPSLFATRMMVVLAKPEVK